MIFEEIYILLIFQFLTLPLMSAQQITECSINSTNVNKNGKHFCWSLEQIDSFDFEDAEKVCKEKNATVVTVFGDVEVALVSDLAQKKEIEGNKPFLTCLRRKIDEIKSSWSPIDFGRVPNFLEIVNNLGNVVFEKEVKVGDRLIISFILDFTERYKNAEILLAGTYESAVTQLKISMESNSSVIMFDRKEVRFGSGYEKLYDMIIVLEFQSRTEMKIEVNGQPAIVSKLYEATFDRLTITNMYLTNFEHSKMDKPNNQTFVRHVKTLAKSRLKKIENPAMTSILTSGFVDVHNSPRLEVFEKLPPFFMSIFEPQTPLEITYEFRLGGRGTDLRNLSISFFEKLGDPPKWYFTLNHGNFMLREPEDPKQQSFYTGKYLLLTGKMLVGALRFHYIDNPVEGKGTVCYLSFYGGHFQERMDTKLLHFWPPAKYITNYLQISSNLPILSTFIRSTIDSKIVSTCGFVADRHDSLFPKIPFNEVFYEGKPKVLCERITNSTTMRVKTIKRKNGGKFGKRNDFDASGFRGIERIWYLICGGFLLIIVVLVLYL